MLRLSRPVSGIGHVRPLVPPVAAVGTFVNAHRPSRRLVRTVRRTWPHGGPALLRLAAATPGAAKRCRSSGPAARAREVSVDAVDPSPRRAAPRSNVRRRPHRRVGPRRHRVGRPRRAGWVTPVEECTRRGRGVPADARDAAPTRQAGPAPSRRRHRPFPRSAAPWAIQASEPPADRVRWAPATANAISHVAIRLSCTRCTTPAPVPIHSAPNVTTVASPVTAHHAQPQRAGGPIPDPASPPMATSMPSAATELVISCNVWVAGSAPTSSRTAHPEST